MFVFTDIYTIYIYIYLGEISGKMTILISKIETMNGLLNDIHHKSKDLTGFDKEMKDGFKNVCIELETIRNSSKSNESTPPMWLELNEVSIEKEAYRKKKQISKIWKHLLNARKQNFWNSLNCEKQANIYNDWINAEIPIIPQKFLIKEIKGEPEMETKLRWDLTIQRIHTEVSLLIAKKERYEQKYQESENLINQEIDQISTNSVADKLREIWSKEISNEEEKSIKRWSEKQKWLESYAENYGKPENPQNQQQKSKNQKQRKPKNFTEQRQRSKTPLRTQWTKNKSQSRSRSRSKNRPKTKNTKPLYSEVVKNRDKKPTSKPNMKRPNLKPNRNQTPNNRNKSLPSKNKNVDQNDVERRTKRIHFLGVGRNKTAYQIEERSETNLKQVTGSTQK